MQIHEDFPLVINWFNTQSLNMFTHCPSRCSRIFLLWRVLLPNRFDVCITVWISSEDGSSTTLQGSPGQVSRRPAARRAAWKPVQVRGTPKKTTNCWINEEIVAIILVRDTVPGYSFCIKYFIFLSITILYVCVNIYLYLSIVQYIDVVCVSRGNWLCTVRLWQYR